MNRDPFSVLGVSSSATEDEIKTAYRKLAKKYHPDLNPGDKSAEEKMKEVNEAYAQALQIRRNGGTWNGGSGYGSSYGTGYGAGGSQGYGGSYYNGNGYGFSGYDDPRQQWQQQGDPFAGFGFNPFADIFGFRGGPQQSAGFRTRMYANPELKAVENHVLARNFHDALDLLNRISEHNADWHALYARADLGLGNRISALEHARKASQMAPGDQDYQMLEREIEAGGQRYQQARQNGYNIRSTFCSNPFLSCCALNLVCNCCLGGRYGFCC